MYGYFRNMFCNQKEKNSEIKEVIDLNENIENSKIKIVESNQELLKQYEEKEAQLFVHIRKRYIDSIYTNVTNIIFFPSLQQGL